MAYRLQDIVYEDGDYFILRVSKGFEVYKSGVTHATRCAHVGFLGQAGLDRAKAEIKRRLA